MAICLLATLADSDSDSDPDPDSDSPVIESIHVVKKGGFKFSACNEEDNIHMHGDWTGTTSWGLR